MRGPPATPSSIEAGSPTVGVRASVAPRSSGSAGFWGEQALDPGSLALRAALVFAFLAAGTAIAAAPGAHPALPKVAEALNGHAERVVYRGQPALTLVPAQRTAGQDADMLALLEGPDFHDGTIELQLAGAPRADAPSDSRGFIGLSFRTGPHGEWSELFYLRPTNGRADDQLRRNHSLQYVCAPEFTWQRLRKESPGVYESWADLEAGAWTSLKIVVEGATARLFVNGAVQPALVVTDLKHGDRSGRVALWAHVETDAFFGPLTITPRSGK